MPRHFTAEEERVIRKELARTGRATCPRCDGLLDLHPVPPRKDVAYVRNRAVVQCAACDLRAAVDRV